MLFCGVAAAEVRGFHPPANPMEEAVESALAFNASRDDVARYLYRQMAPDALLEEKLSAMLSPALRQALREAEADKVYLTCGGVYQQDTSCGFNLNPLTCLTIPLDRPLFRTDSSASYMGGDYNAQISMAMAGGQQVIAIYYMVKSGERWLIDAVECPIERLRFH